MKKLGWVFVSIMCVLFLVSCSKESKIEKRTVSKSIDSKSVEKLTGEWQGEGGGSTKRYVITLANKQLKLNDVLLQVTETQKNMVFTQTLEEKPLYYDFRMEDEKVILLSSYPVKKGMTGGSFAPIELTPLYTSQMKVDPFDKEQVSKYKNEFTQIFSLYEKNSPFRLEITSFTIEGDPLIETIDYDGEKINYTLDSTADKFGPQEIRKYHYYKMKYTETKETEDDATIQKAYVLTEASHKGEYEEIQFDVSDTE